MTDSCHVYDVIVKKEYKAVNKIKSGKGGNAE